MYDKKGTLSFVQANLKDSMTTEEENLKNIV